ncbi:MAG: hypothetical protein HQ561_04970 [Desulfobacteraceae bacterium]|nr:hypothetical protein [Desulfobacteraceae bacterium]
MKKQTEAGTLPARTGRGPPPRQEIGVHGSKGSGLPAIALAQARPPAKADRGGRARRAGVQDSIERLRKEKQPPYQG